MRSKKWWFVAAGVGVSFARWWSKVEPATAELEEAEPVRIAADDLAALATGDFEMELTRARRAPRSKRLVTSIAFVALFCAGASLTAIAGNAVVQTGATVAAEDTAQPSDPAAPTDAAPAPAPATTDAAPADPAPADPAPADPAPAPAPADPAPADSAPAAAPADPAPADPAPADPAAAAPADPAPAAPADTPAAPAPAEAASTPDPSDATPVAASGAAVAAAVQAAPQVHRVRHARRQAAQVEHTVAPAPAPDVTDFAPVPSFVPALPFDLGAWEHDNPGSTTGATAVAIAEHFVGTPYVWGGASPSGGFDCSGLMRYVYAQLGVALPHYAASQFALFPHLAPSDLRPGDLVFFEPKIDGPGHVAMYAGGDAIIEAPHTGALVRIGSFAGDAAALGFMGAVRPYAGDRAVPLRTVAAHKAVVQRPYDAHLGAPGLAFSV